MFHHDAVRTLGGKRARGPHRPTLDEMDRVTARTPEQVRRVESPWIESSAAEWDDCQVQFAAMQRDGFAVECCDDPEGRGLLFPDNGTLQPLARCRTLALLVREVGAALFKGSPALALSGTKVATPQGWVRCKAVIVAVAGRLDTLLPELGGYV